MNASGSARDRLEAAHAADPLANPFGCYVGDPHPMGLALLFWYPSAQARRLAFLEDHAFADDHEAQDAEYVARWQPVHRQIAAELDRHVDGTLRVDVLRPLTAPFFSILWAGTFEDLCESDDATCEEVREWFLPDEEGPPIPATMRADFARSLHEFGA